MIPAFLDRKSHEVLIAIIIAGAMILAGAAMVIPWAANSQVTSVPIRGYLWSQNIGWVDLNCLNASICGTSNFGLSLAQDGTISGYAWSDTLGWISANSADLSGCPTAPCTAKVTGSNVNGWLKVINGGGAQSGGWDGFIRLNGVTLVAGTFAGYAWGDINVDWLDFSRATTAWGTCTPTYSCSGLNIIYTDTTCVQSTTATCIAPAFCSAGSSVCNSPAPTAVGSSTNSTISGHLQAQPSIVAKGKTTKMYWNFSNVSSCSVTGTNGDSWSGTSGGGIVTGAVNAKTTYTMDCTALNSTHVIETTSVNILPTFQEK